MQFRSPLLSRIAICRLGHCKRAQEVAAPSFFALAMPKFELCITDSNGLGLDGPTADVAPLRSGLWFKCSLEKNDKLSRWLQMEWSRPKELWLQSPVTLTLKCFLCAPPDEDGVMWCKPVDDKCPT